MQDRYLDFMDDWHAGQRHLAYTVIAVLLVVVMGLIIVPTVISRTALPVATDSQRLAERYIEAISKVKGATPPASAAEVIRSYGDDGGKTCHQSLAGLRNEVVVRPKGGRSHIDPVALEQVRTALKVYCPKRDDQLAAFLKLR